MSEKVEIIVTAEHAEDAEKCADRLRKVGMEVTSVLEMLGQVIGRIPEEDTRKLEEVEGVAAVEVSKEVKLPPPDADVQ